MLLVITSLSEQLTGNMSAVSLAANWSRDTTAPPSLVGLSAPAPEVDGGPVRDVEDDEEDGEHAEEHQVSPGEPEMSQWLWSREMQFLFQNGNFSPLSCLFVWRLQNCDLLENFAVFCKLY